MLRLGAGRGLLVAIAAATVLVTGCSGSPFRRMGHEEQPPVAPPTVTWHNCPYHRLDVVETLASATAFEHQASAYANLSLEQIGDADGMPIYGLPLNLDNPYRCNGPWFIHLKLGPDEFRRYQRPGGP